MSEEQNMATSTDKREKDRPLSPASSSISMRSDWSKDNPPNLNEAETGREKDRPLSPAPSSISMRSDWSKDNPPNLNEAETGLPENDTPESPTHSDASTTNHQSEQNSPDVNDENAGPLEKERSASPALSYVSMTSDLSEDNSPNLSEVVERREKDRPLSPASSSISMRSDWSKDNPPNLNEAETGLPENDTPESPTHSDASTTNHQSEQNSPDVNDENAGPLEKERSASPALSYVSMTSDLSEDNSPNLSEVVESLFEKDGSVSAKLSDVSMISDWSKDNPPNLNEVEMGPPERKIPVSSATSNISMGNNWSKDNPPKLNEAEAGLSDKDGPVCPKASDILMRSNSSEDSPLKLNAAEAGPLEKQRSVSPAPSNTSLMMDQSEQNRLDFKEEDAGPLESKRPVSPATGNISMRSDWYKDNPRNLNEAEMGPLEKERSASPALSNDSMTSDRSKEDPPNLNEVEEGLPENDTPESPTHSDASTTNHQSEQNSPDVNEENAGPLEKERSASPALSNVPKTSDRSKEDRPNLNEVEEGRPQHKEPVHNSNTKKNVQSDGDPPHSEISEDPSPQNRIQLTEKEEVIKQRLRDHLKKRFPNDYETEKSQSENYTELIKMKTVQGKQHEKTLQGYNGIFGSSQKTQVRTVITNGVAGIGKTFKTKKFMVDWAEGKSNIDIDLIVPLHFSELNSRGDKDLSVEDLLNHFFTEVKNPSAPAYDKYKIAFILDGLEQCELPLNFENNKELTDIKEQGSMDELLTNLIEGKLLPSARLWIISRPSGVGKIPPGYIDRVTECRETLQRRQQLESSLKNTLKNKITQVEYTNHPNQENTEHLIRKVKTDEANDEDKGGQTETKSVTTVNEISEIFKEEQGKPIRTVLTTGEADIGISFHVNKFIQGWPENKTKSSIRQVFSYVGSFFRTNDKEDTRELIFPLPFSELKLIKEEKSLVGLLNHFFKETKEYVISDYEQFRVLFVLDGLDTTELLLDFENSNILTDVREPASVDVILTNLIKGNLLPSAQIWITCRPSSAKQLPDDLFDRVTEIREKEEVIKQRLRDHLKKRFPNDYETEKSQSENYTELIKMKTVQGKQHEKTLQGYNGIFGSSQKTQVRTVITNGVAGIGKTFKTKKFMVDWAEGKSNKDIDLIVPLHFSELNSRGDKDLSVEDLLNHFFTEVKNPRAPAYDKYNIAFILDGLEQCELPLNFENNKELTDIKEQGSMDELLTNLIKRKLLPSARLWIISRPSGVGKIPPGYIDRVTECRETLKRRQQLESKLKDTLKNKITQVGKTNHPNQKNTEHLIRKVKTDEANDEDKDGQTETKSVTTVNEISEIFKEEQGKPIRTVLTTGEADIGKSFHVNKFIQMWVNNERSSFTWFKDSTTSGKLIFPLTFSEFMKIKEREISLVELLHHFFKETEEYVISNYDRFRVLFVLDGLDTSELPLDFNRSDALKDVREPASVDVILTNLIKGNLLPSAKIWITCRPSSAKQLPDDLFDRVTEIREKEEVIKQRLRDHLKKRFPNDYEAEKNQSENYTELIEMKTGQQHEKTLQGYNEIFGSSQKNQVRTVLMNGVAGIGKTFKTKKFMVDWAEDKSNKDIDLIVPLHFSELNSRRCEVQSMEDLLNHLFTEVKTPRVPAYDKYKIAFILDGLEQCELPLNFENNKELTDIKEQGSMDELLTNLIKRKLLPSARLWIISRPSGVGKIPPGYIDRVTECRETLERRQQLASSLKGLLKKEINEDTDHPNQKSTELIIKKATRDEVNDKDGQSVKGSITKVNEISEIFKEEERKPIRTVLTTGNANMGKSFHVNKFIQMWAKNESSMFTWLTSWFPGKGKAKDELIFPFTFSELKSIKEKKSLVGLLNHFFKETSKYVISDYAQFRVLFILDGLDTTEFPLHFEKTEILTDVREPASVDVILTNLIKGNLLPSAQIWITCRPSSAKQLPDDLFDRVTEIREKDAKEMFKEYLQKRFPKDYEAEKRCENNTELIVMKTDKQHEQTLQGYNEIFGSSQEDKMQTVLMKGVADIGKTFKTKKFMVDWAEDKSNKDIDLIVPLHFSELNSRRCKVQSMEDLLNHFFTEVKTPRAPAYDKYNIAFILDGLEQFELPLNFENNKELTDIKERASMDELLTNLIKGKLLSSARLWIISRPSGVGKIPPGYIDRVTECRETLQRRQQLESSLKNTLKNKITQVEYTNHPNQENTEHLIRKVKTDEANDEDKDGQTETKSVTTVNEISEIFKEEQGKPIRTVLTTGEADIGKSFHVNKFIQGWAENKTKSSIRQVFSYVGSFFRTNDKEDTRELIFPLPFSELKLIKEEKSLVGLLNHFFKETKEYVISDYEQFRVLFVLDGLDTTELLLDFENSNVLTDVREPASVDVILTNLIKGNLLPSAQIWITCRPSSAKQLPDDLFDRVTEIREKEEVIKQRLRDHLKKRFPNDYETEKSQSENYTELIKMKTVQGKQHEKTLQGYNGIFGSSQKTQVRTVITNGVAGIGKTFKTKKFMVDWAEGKSNKDIDLIVPLHFSELNSRGDKDLSVEDLLNHFFTEVKNPRAPAYDKYNIAFILDGLEQCELPLNFENNKELTDIKEQGSMDELLTNLIKRKLLPSARLWIISRPSGVGKIPPGYIDRVTECRETLKRRQQLESKLKDTLKNKITQVGKTNHPNQKNTEHLIRKVKTDEANDEDKDGQTETKSVTTVNEISEIFKEEQGKPIRTVLTTGEADIGISFHVNKFIQMWVNNERSSFTWFKDSTTSGKLIFPLTFSEFMKIKEREISLVELLHHFFKETEEYVISNYDRFRVLFVLDGLDTSELPLDFNRSDALKDVREPASVDVILTNLIKGNLLPSAKIWITCRPSSAKQLPDDLFDRVTEIREKEEVIKQRLRDHLKKRFPNDYEAEKNQSENYTELIEMKTGQQHEKTLQGYNEIFGSSQKNQVRTVLMNGVAGIGKTFKTKKFMVDWAEDKSNKDIDLIVPLHFSELNSRGDKDLSVEDLLNHFFTEVKNPRVPAYDKYKIAFILDGLEQCELPLDFENNKELTDIKERASMDELLTNLIKRKLLSSARLWIISRPSGVGKIPPQHIDRVTECRETLERRQQLASTLRNLLRKEFTEEEDSNHPNQTKTEHIIKKVKTKVNDEDKGSQTVPTSVTKVNEISEIFKEQGKPTRAVLTIGKAAIGKSFHVNKFIQMWTKCMEESSFFTWWKDSMGKTEDEELIFPLTFSKLAIIKEEKVSLVGLLNHFFEETKKYVISNYAQFRVLFVLDGLDTTELPLDFTNTNILTDVREPASVDVLLTNLIKGNLLPSAQIWITCRPSSAKQLPDDLFDRMTEIREKPDIRSQRKLKSQLEEQFACVSEGIDKQKTSALLKEIYTDLYIIEGGGEVNDQHEIIKVQDAKFKPREETPIKYHDIFKPASSENIRTVLTTGIAGIGKTFASMKYMLDWAEGTASEDTYFTFPLPFRELNLRKEGEHSFEELLHQFFPAMKKSEINDYDRYQILIVLDGFDECRLDLNFSECMDCRDVRKTTSVDVLLVNLIRGNLLPKAQIWITSRPAVSNKIPAETVDRVTEVRGFNDEQKEEYFRKRFSDEDLTEKILSHVKKSRSLYIMCHIPVFCWITSHVLGELLSSAPKDEEKKKEEMEERMPKTLTDMYIHFLLLQCKQANVKYGQDKSSESSDVNSCWNPRNRETVLSLGKLAFEELKKGNPLFTEEDLTDCGVDIEKSAVFSGLFTQVKREQSGLYQQKFFCFVHLSIQEFLAAFYVTHAFSNKDENLLSDSPASDLYKTAVDKALDSKAGDWDLFLRFLLGLSLETNQNLLKGVLKKTENKKMTNKKTSEYIQRKMDEENSDPVKNINLLHCLNELNDHSLVESIKNKLPNESFSAAQWSALTYVLLISDENLDVFDLKKYLKSEKVLLGMLPVVKVSKTALLRGCKLTEESCKGLTSSVLTCASSNLTKLDLSHNDLLDSGVELLADGLKSVHCKLETLKLSGCQVTEKGCSALASAIRSHTTSHLKHLDLSYNHPGDSGESKLCAIREDPDKELETLCFDHSGAHRLKPGLKKYVTHLTFNEDTASKRLVLCEENRKVKTVRRVEEKVVRPENEERFKRSQVFCKEELKGFCYWEVEWRGVVGIAVSYAEVRRRWDSSSGLGCNDMSWSLLCSETGYTAIHGKTSKQIKQPTCQRIAVFLDWEGGYLRYYSVTSGELTLIHTFRFKFRKPLFPGFWFKKGSVTLCEVE